uniref:Uncharacterized protein n=1 Tax=Heterorhabditis bacteriophora TaxID=37862 RepID=A0A1I7W636_HETBA
MILKNTKFWFHLFIIFWKRKLNYKIYKYQSIKFLQN